jgi:hypothetical protein
MDCYTKAVLTVIAVALVMIAIEQIFDKAVADPTECGALESPCAVYNVWYSGISKIDSYRWHPCFNGGNCYEVKIAN